MRRAEGDKKRYLFSGILVLILAIALTVLSYASLKGTEYGFMILFAFLSAICYYVSVFRFFGYHDAKTAIELIDTLEYMELDPNSKVTEIADAMGWKKAQTKKFISKCKKRGYLA